jgi:hypothetical protein
MSKHQREPWEVFTFRETEMMPDCNPIAECGLIFNPGDFFQRYVLIGQTNEQMPGGTALDDAERIVKCVNACAGMKDPAKEIARLQALDCMYAATHRVQGELWETMHDFKGTLYPERQTFE